MIGARVRSVLRRVLPLAARKRLAIGVDRLAGGRNSYWWTMELLRDFAAEHPNDFHRFLWSNHLAYAESYDVASRFGAEGIHPSRVALFADLEGFLRGRGVLPERDIHSVLEVGASLGYLLRHLEQGWCRHATRFLGVDIDAQAIAAGAAHLGAAGSRVELRVADMAELDTAVGDESFDIVLCAGVLMYLTPPDAARVVAWMLGHTRRCLVLAGLAHPDQDNGSLTEAALRERDGTFIHNLDGMVEAAGGRVLWRRWDGAAQLGGNTIYFLFAAPAGTP